MQDRASDSDLHFLEQAEDGDDDEEEEEEEEEEEMK
jgi:hypothetical protein